MVADVERSIAVSENFDQMLHYWRYWNDLLRNVLDKANHARLDEGNEATAGDGKYGDFNNSSCVLLSPKKEKFVFEAFLSHFFLVVILLSDD